MSYGKENFKHPRGGALVGALLIVVGLVLGAGAMIGLRLAGIDYMTHTGSIGETKAVDDKVPEAVAPPQESQLRSMIAELDRSTKQFERDQSEAHVKWRLMKQEKAALTETWSYAVLP